MSAVTTIRTSVSRKLGPLPAWAWLLLLIAAVLVYRHVRARDEQTIGGQFSLPDVRASTPIAAPAEGAAGGSGPSVPELPSDLLAQFFAHQTATIDSLTSALTGTSAAQAGGPGAPPGAEAQGVAADPFTDPIPPEILAQEPYVAAGFTGTDPNFAAGALGLGVIEPQSTFGPSPYVDYSGTYAVSAMLPPPQEQPAPAVQPAVADLYSADNELLQAAASQVVQGGQSVAA